MSIKSRVIAKIRQLIFDGSQVGADVSIDESAEVRASFIGGTAEIGKHARIIESKIRGKVSVGRESFIQNATINGNDITIAENCKLYHCNVVGTVRLGRYTSLWGPNLDLVSRPGLPLEIGSFCSVARNVSMQTFNHNHKKATTYFIGSNYFNEKWDDEQTGKGGIRIGNDVWIGTHCVILGGVTIGNGAVIAANSVVTKDVPPYAIAAGSPAKVISYRFDEVMIADLQKLEWWNWSDEQMQANKSFFEGELTPEIVSKYLKAQ